MNYKLYNWILNQGVYLDINWEENNHHLVEHPDENINKLCLLLEKEINKNKQLEENLNNKEALYNIWKEKTLEARSKLEELNKIKVDTNWMEKAMLYKSKLEKLNKIMAEEIEEPNTKEEYYIKYYE